LKATTGMGKGSLRSFHKANQSLNDEKDTVTKKGSDGEDTTLDIPARCC
jgi:hypothetical protein